MSSLNIKLLISIFLAAPPALAQLTPVPSGSSSPGPGFNDDCPNGILCLPRQEEVVTVIDPDCESEPVIAPTPLVQSANLPVQIRPAVLPTTLVTVTECPGGCDEELPATLTICPPEGCTTEAAPVPVATRLAVCPPEECPECSPDACTPCPPENLECEICEGCPPICPDYCPPPVEVITSDLVAPIRVPVLTPTPSPSFVTPVPLPSPTVILPGPAEETTAPTSPPVAGAERMAVAPGVYVAVAAVFLAVNLF